MLEIDNDEYGDISTGLVKRVVGALVRSLSSTGYIDFSSGVTEHTRNAVYEIAFDVLSQLETSDGHEQNGKRYPVVVAFAEFPASVPISTPPTSAERLIASSRRTDLHGQLDDEIIRAVIDEFNA